MLATCPTDPIAAVVHDDPYPYYARLARHTPFTYNADLRCWIAASAAAAEAVLTSEACRVRPADEPVPFAIVGTRAGDAFRRFARMNDGSAHGPLRACATTLLAAFDPKIVDVTARRIGGELLARVPAPDVNAYAEQLPALTIADLLGIREPLRRNVPAWTRTLVRSVAPGATRDDAAAADAAALALRDALDSRGTDDDEDARCAEIGLLFQTYDATAGAIGNTLRALRDATEAPSLDDALARTFRYDPPVQNTRRFASEATTIGDSRVRPGDKILVVLAAANRDPTARASLSFGAGPHRCPGEDAAVTIARAGIATLLDHGLDPATLGPVRYRPSANVRVAQFGGAQWSR
ncbi:MAG TPA: hypothetical protein VGN14_09105 [Candidatus Elarobacter sp.]|jgi:cytochrome P450